MSVITIGIPGEKKYITCADKKTALVNFTRCLARALSADIILSYAVATVD